MIDRHRMNVLPAVLIAVVAVSAASLIGSAATLPVIPNWYAGLVKPSFNPPNWIFGPVWTTLYVMMGVAFFRILRLPYDIMGRQAGVRAFLTQIGLNGFWSVVFFGNQNIAGGLFVVVALWLSIIVTLALFWKLDRVAAWLMAPCLAWVSFAGVLNAALWSLN